MWSFKAKARGISQVALFHKYAAAALMAEDERRDLLWEETGYRTSKAPQLTQRDFDAVMGRLERRLRAMAADGLLAEDDLRRRHIRLDYWAGRNPEGAANTRQRRAMWEAWVELQALLPAECRNEAWLLGFVERCGGGASDFWTATSAQAGTILDGLRMRIRQERARR